MLFAIVSRGKNLGTRLLPHRFEDNRYHVRLGKEVHTSRSPTTAISLLTWRMAIRLR
jgi:hypothetical protein